MFNTSERIERIRDFIKHQKIINTVQKQMGSNTKYSDLVYNDIEWACKEIEELKLEIVRTNNMVKIGKFSSKKIL